MPIRGIRDGRTAAPRSASQRLAAPPMEWLTNSIVGEASRRGLAEAEMTEAEGLGPDRQVHMDVGHVRGFSRLHQVSAAIRLQIRRSRFTNLDSPIEAAGKESGVGSEENRGRQGSPALQSAF